ncbi:MAG: transporter ATP-binding protein, partial [Devosia sp.]|nr:transporter ATP-binding protein [Devosia sp.]
DAAASLRDAYAELLWSGRPALPVRRNGQIVGQVTREALARLAARPQ